MAQRRRRQRQKEERRLMRRRIEEDYTAAARPSEADPLAVPLPLLHRGQGRKI